ncbi:MAG: HEPN domain-containing protein [Pseudomonadota bacterium]|nr:HEPN domain-containing protein [Pseudomonadota bacterium]MEA3241020.1 HEPN domain-containing protein [Pseudomonadota bacterium]
MERQSFCRNYPGSFADFENRKDPPAQKASLYSLFSESQKNFIDILEPMNIEARYPSNKERLLKSLTEERCTQILQETEELHLWIKQKLLQN